MTEFYDPWTSIGLTAINENEQFPGTKNVVDLKEEAKAIKNKKIFDRFKFDPMGTMEKFILEDLDEDAFKKADDNFMKFKKGSIWDQHPSTRLGMNKPWPVVDMELEHLALKDPRVKEGSLSHANTNYDLDPNKGHSVPAKWYHDTKAIKRDLRQKAMDEAALKKVMDWLENSDEIIAKEYAALPFMEKMKYNKDYYIDKLLTNNYEKLKPMLAPLAKAAEPVAAVAKPIAKVAGPLGAAYGALEYLKGSPANEGEEEALRRMRNRVYNKGYRGPLSN